MVPCSYSLSGHKFKHADIKFYSRNGALSEHGCSNKYQSERKIRDDLERVGGWERAGACEERGRMMTHMLRIMTAYPRFGSDVLSERRDAAPREGRGNKWKRPTWWREIVWVYFPPLSNVSITMSSPLFRRKILRNTELKQYFVDLFSGFRWRCEILEIQAFIDSSSTLISWKHAHDETA